MAIALQNILRLPAVELNLLQSSNSLAALPPNSDIRYFWLCNELIAFIL
jgi:hypothetical protein